MEWIFVWLFAIFLLYVIYCYTTAGIAWLPQQHKKMLEQTENVAYNTSISLTFDNKTPV